MPAAAPEKSEGCGISGGLWLLALAAVGGILAAEGVSSARGIATVAIDAVAALTLFLGALWAFSLHRLRPGSADTAAGLGMAGGFLLGADGILREGVFTEWNAVFLPVFVVLAGLGYWYAWDMSKGDGSSPLARFRTWSMAAAAANVLGLRRRRFSLGVNASGTIDGASVRVTASRRGVTVEASLAGIPADLSLEAEPGSDLTRAVFRETVRTGDGHFDARAFIRGSLPAALAALDGEARAALLPLLAHGATLSGGWLRMTRHERGRGRTRLEAKTDLAELARSLAAAARLLARSRGGIPAALLANVSSDREPGVRASSMACLRRFHPDAPETAAARKIALEDPEPVVREAAKDPERDAGSLTLATAGDAGALSTPAEAGAVSLPKKDPAR